MRKSILFSILLLALFTGTAFAETWSGEITYYDFALAAIGGSRVFVQPHVDLVLRWNPVAISSKGTVFTVENEDECVGEQVEVETGGGGGGEWGNLFGGSVGSPPVYFMPAEDFKILWESTHFGSAIEWMFPPWKGSENERSCDAFNYRLACETMQKGSGMYDEETVEAYCDAVDACDEGLAYLESIKDELEFYKVTATIQSWPMDFDLGVFSTIVCSGEIVTPESRKDITDGDTTIIFEVFTAEETEVRADLEVKCLAVTRVDTDTGYILTVSPPGFIQEQGGELKMNLPRSNPKYTPMETITLHADFGTYSTDPCPEQPLEPV